MTSRHSGAACALCGQHPDMPDDFTEIDTTLVHYYFRDMKDATASLAEDLNHGQIMAGARVVNPMKVEPAALATKDWR